MPAPRARRRASLVVSAAPLATPAAAGPKHGGHLFFYFTGEGAATGEQVYLAASRGHDPWRATHCRQVHGTVVPVTSAEPARVRAAYS